VNPLLAYIAASACLKGWASLFTPKPKKETSK
jgi:hypothetical protein